MAEPRMRARTKGQQFEAKDLRGILTAFGDDFEPLPETMRVFDEILTDYIIEMCHMAGRVATMARRAKVKVDDFKFVLRKDPRKLARVYELLSREKELKKARAQFHEDPKQDAKLARKERTTLDNNDEENTPGPRGTTRKKDQQDDEDDEDAERSAKRRKKNAQGQGHADKT